MEPYFELTLYQAHCNADGCPEMIFNTNPLLNKEEKDYKEKFNRAMKTVQKYLSYGDKSYGIVIGGMEGIVQSEENALKLINFSEENIKGAEGIIKLFQSIHGRITFSKNIIFNGWDYPQLKELAEKLKKSDSMPDYIKNMPESFWCRVLKSYG